MSGRDTVAHVWRSWRSLRREELSWFLLMGIFYGLVDVSSIFYVMDDVRWPAALANQMLTPLLVSLVILTTWLPASRSAIESRWRVVRLGAAVLVGAVLAKLLYDQLMPMLNLPSIADLARARKGEHPYKPIQSLNFIGECLSLCVTASLSVAWYEMAMRRRRTRARLEALLREQSAMQRDAVAARLAALQAQVEPQFLFDTLVDIERAYERGDHAAPEQMERLIRHLRVALPRLRERGVTLESEAALLDSYLAVVAGRQRGALPLATEWSAWLAPRPMPPMLLLPLAQLMLRDAARLPTQARLSAQEAAGGGLRLRLSFDRGGLCGEETALRALGERLDRLDRAPGAPPPRLHCRSNAEDTEFTLELPA
ncbi:histidine kinase [Mitsuaria sp. GD03876]|uniref:histidine kinase n=1 Tax=Mitsuaria sp. GD03876 TaxID=2975399 RepID=UPI00244A9953|nr:histidine kinase [Mitsuaria sp. GD03876]MDH0864889.1 histidine kinase [Mitsuaria sp. GD03876]